jgi:probable HAF family extracellular repeat protein
MQGRLSAITYPDQSGFYLYSNGVFSTVIVPVATGVTAQKINNAGAVVGSYFDASNVEHGFLYANGNFATIDFPGARSTLAYGINNAGQIVGEYTDTNFVDHGFLDIGGILMSFDMPGAKGTLAFGINDLGQVVGEGAGSYLAVETPEPSGLTLTALSMLAMLGWRVRRRGFDN